MILEKFSLMCCKFVLVDWFLLFLVSHRIHSHRYMHPIILLIMNREHHHWVLRYNPERAHKKSFVLVAF